MAKIVFTEQIKEGMVLSEPLLNNFGQTLMPSGTKLTERHKRILKTWNIMQVSIKSDNEEEEIEISAGLLNIAKERLATRVLWEPRTSQEEDMLRMATIHMARQISKEKMRE